MKIIIALPQVDPKSFKPPLVCPYPGCGGRDFWPIQEVPKRLRDVNYVNIMVRRYLCLSCFRTFRVYPEGISKSSLPQGIKRFAAMCYFLGLSCQSVSSLLKELGINMSKTAVYIASQEVAKNFPNIQRKKIIQTFLGPFPGNHIAAVKIDGNWYPLEFNPNKLVLTFEEEKAANFKESLISLAQMLGIEILVNS